MPPDPYDPEANPDLRSAIVAFWQTQEALTRISRFPYADEASVGVAYPYCVLRVPTTRLVQQDTGGNKHLESTYQFAIYSPDQDVAADLGLTMTALLDGLHRTKPRFGDGYLLCWDWKSETLDEIPEARSGGQNTIWRQTHTYVADIVNTRGVV
jgi:hypothetical protein